MARKTDISSRRDVGDRIDTTRESMQEKEIDLEELAADVETVRQTLENLDLGGTADGRDAVSDAMESTDDVAVDEFDTEDRDLGEIHGEAEDFERELDEQSGTAETDVGRIEDGMGSLKNEASRKEISNARDAALEDVDFLAGQIERAREARERSEQAQRGLEERVQGNRR